MSFPRDLAELLAAFVDGGVRFLVIGGHAVSLHARPRTTKDLDLWLDATASNEGGHEGSRTPDPMPWAWWGFTAKVAGPR